METRFPVHLFVSTPRGPEPFSSRQVRAPLPHDPDAPALVCGPYFKALVQLLLEDDARLLRQASRNFPGSRCRDESPCELNLCSEKHGAFYHVARVEARFPHGGFSLGLDVAASPRGRACMDREYDLLRELSGRFQPPRVPRPLFKGEALYEDEGGERLLLQVMGVEWFDDHHEFHLSRSPGGGDAPVVKVWDWARGEAFLTVPQTRSLYRGAAEILTGCMDPLDFRQIHPWHHAAGDMVLRRLGDEVDVKLITVRDFRCLCPPGKTPEECWLALACFFFHLTVRLRLDRLDGTGEYAWAPPSCLAPAVEGFLGGWDRKTGACPCLPPSAEVLDVFRRFGPKEWASLGETVLSGGLVEAGEGEFLRARLKEHITSLMNALTETDGPAASAA